MALQPVSTGGIVANNFAEAMQQGYSFGTQQRQEREQRNRLAELEGLSSKVISGDLDATSRAYALDPNQAKTLQGEGDRRRQKLFGLATSLKRAEQNPQLQAALYRTAVPYMRSEFGPEIPEMFDSASVMPIVEQVLAQGDPRALSGNGGTIQSQKISDDGYIINTYRNGRMEKTQQKVDRQMWLRDHPGMTAPELVGKDGSVLQVGQETPSSLPQGGLDVGEGVGRVRMNIEGVDPQRQQRVAQTVSMMQQAGYPDEEIEQFIQGQLPQAASNIAAQRQAFARPSAAQDAAATERAKLQAQQDFLPTELSMRTEADIAKSRGVEQAKSEQERASNERAKTAQLNNVDRGLSRIDTAIKALSGGMVNTGPLDGRLMVSTPQGQELEAAVGAIQNDMLALTRVPGIGSQSDLEAKIANLKYPSIYNHPSVNAANVQQLKAFMEDLRSQITGSPAQGGRAVVRTGTSNGRKVIQYSDGSVEYGN